MGCRGEKRIVEIVSSQQIYDTDEIARALADGSSCEEQHVVGKVIPVQATRPIGILVEESVRLVERQHLGAPCAIQ